MNGDEIRQRREANGWTQQELARRLGVGVRTVSGWERNESIPRNRLGMMRDLFGISDEDEAGDPLRTASETALLAELLRRASMRERERSTA